MNNYRSYRITALLLAVIFCLFNVGLLIIVSACPMMRANNPHASCCTAAAHSPIKALAVSKNSSCCRTTLAADRNTTEFLQSTNQVQHLLKIEPLSHVVVTDPFDGIRELHASAFATAGTLAEAFHPLDDDIPIFVSSLLI